MALAATLVLVFVMVTPRFHLRAPAGAQRIAMFEWASRETPADALFIIPPGMTDFRLFARRSIRAESGLFAADPRREWFAREWMVQISEPDAEALAARGWWAMTLWDRGYATAATCSGMVALLRATGADYFVRQAQCPSDGSGGQLNCTGGPKIAFTNSAATVYTLDASKTLTPHDSSGASGMCRSVTAGGYVDKAVYLRMAQLDAEHWWFVARRRILADQIARLSLPGSARILEVGCGPGGNLAMLSRFGRVDAMEIDGEARAIASARSGIEVKPGALPHDIGHEVSSFDLVAAFDVIEHVGPDAESIRALTRLLKPGGALIITVPAYQWLWSAHDERHHHKRRYTRSAVRKLAVDAGLAVEKCSHFNSFLFPMIAGIRSLKKLVETADSPDDKTPSRLVNAALTGIFGSERFPLRYLSMPFGVSILCIARRR